MKLVSCLDDVAARSCKFAVVQKVCWLISIERRLWKPLSCQMGIDVSCAVRNDRGKLCYATSSHRPDLGNGKQPLNVKVQGEADQLPGCVAISMVPER